MPKARSGLAVPARRTSVSVVNAAPSPTLASVAAAYRSERYLSKAARALIRVMTDVAASRFQNG